MDAMTTARLRQYLCHGLIIARESPHDRATGPCLPVLGSLWHITNPTWPTRGKAMRARLNVYWTKQEDPYAA